MSPSSILFAGLMPHAPILVPSVGGTRLRECRATTSAMTELCRRAMAMSPEAVVVLSPHSPLHRDAIGIWHSDPLEGTLGRFGAEHERISVPLDPLFSHLLEEQAAKRGIRTWRIEHATLDHGATVPLHYMIRAGWRGPTAVIGVNDLEPVTYQRLGEAIAVSARLTQRRTVLLASGDMSHRLTIGSPCGFDPAGPLFDRRFVELLQSGAPGAIVHLDQTLCAAAAEDVTAVTDIALAALDYETEHRRVLSYEGPFGVGYTVAILAERDREASVRARPWVSELEQLPAIARRSVEAYFEDPAQPPPFAARGDLAESHGVFVTLRSATGELRGCCGAARPAGADLVAATWLHAREAAFEDPRFAPLRQEELSHSAFCVSVLSALEPVHGQDELDPARFGILITGVRSGRRAVLLPGIPHVDTVSTQLRVAQHKGGIAEREDVVIHRFSTREFHEVAAAGAARGHAHAT